MHMCIFDILAYYKNKMVVLMQACMHGYHNCKELSSVFLSVTENWEACEEGY